MALIESFSGIRGIYGKELTDEIILKYGRAYYLYLKEMKLIKSPKIVIGRDTRPSGKKVFDLLCLAIDSSIIDIGVAPTPVVENAVRAFNSDGGIIITASHNEPEYNGFKFLGPNGAILTSRDSEWIIKKAKEVEIKNIELKQQKIEKKEKSAIEEYKKFVKDIVKINKVETEVKVLVDPNGGSGIVAKEIFDEYSINAFYVNMKEMEFNRLVEPKEESLKYLLSDIKKNNCDFAIGFDCDADRVEILLNDGTLVSGNHILALIAEEILKNSIEKNKHVVVNDATSYLVKEVIEKLGAEWFEVEVGETNVVDKMILEKAQIGGEGSNGGVIIPPSRCRDGILTFIVLLKLIKEKNKPLKEIIDELPKYYYLKEKIKLKQDFETFREKIEDHYAAKGFEILETGDSTGGLKAILGNSWVWFRQSKTEDKVLRVIVDSKDEKLSKDLLIEAKNLVD